VCARGSVQYWFDRMRAPTRFRFAPRTHPGLAPELLESAGLAASDVLDLCTAHNPYGPPPAVLAAAHSCELTRYPDSSAAQRRLAEHWNLAPDHVLIGDGATELLWSCARALLRPGDSVLMIEPCAGEFALAARQCGARVTRWRSVERTGHRVDLQQVAELMRLQEPTVVGVCAPGSPTGSSLRFGALDELAATFPDTYFVVDQSWLSLSDDHADASLPPRANVLCVRSLAPELRLAGVRLGYLLCSAGLRQQIDATRPSFSTGAQASAVLLAALGESEFVATSRSRLQTDRARLAAGLDRLELSYAPSVAPFLLVRLARASEISRELLERHRIAVCDASAYGLPDHLRIAAVGAQHEPKLMAALTEILQRRRLVRGREP
jgi:histidinol-phosphate aminotransferase